MTKEERLAKSRELLSAMKKFDLDCLEAGESVAAGVDEVGRGPLAGPVLAACVVLPEDFEVLGINDSKKLSDKKRRELSGVILETALAYGFGIKDNHYIDRHNILEATKEAMREAVSACEAMLLERSGKRIDRLLIDAVRLPGTGKEQSNPTKGDQKSLSIAAASIIAKVRRDDMMIAFDSEFPGYDLAGNKGYGTKAHYDGLKKQGLSPIHRKTFLRNLDEH